MRNFFSRIKVFLFAFSYYYYYKYKLFGNGKRQGNKAIFVQLKHNHFKRYLYVFIKFLHLEGYTIYLNPDFKSFYILQTDQFCNYLFSEKIICIGRPSKNLKVILLDDTVLNANYFEELKWNISSNNTYYVPMSQHPLMYKEGWWNTPIISGKRKHSLFMTGNFDEHTYSTIKKDNVFNVMSRLELHSILSNNQLLYSIDSLKKLAFFCENDTKDFKIIILNRLKLDVPMNELRIWLAKFDFYFALPGVVMPFSHNIIEAMSVGCIPFLQQSYADMFKPPLVNGKQAITFATVEDLENKIKNLFSLDIQKIRFMRNEVDNYYNSFLTPSKVVDRIVKSDFKNIYLQAEQYSVSLLKESRRNNVKHLCLKEI